MTTATKPPVVSILKSKRACDDAIAWAEPYGSDHRKAWAECPRGDWMLWILVRIHQPKQGDKRHRKLVGCLADIAAEVLPIFETRYPNDKRVRDCIETLRRYAAGTATIDDVKAARKAAYAAAADAAAYAAAYAAGSYAAAYAAYAAADAADAAGSYAAAARTAIQKRSAEIVRQHYPRPPLIKEPTQ
jgi:hypothetical protein